MPTKYEMHPMQLNPATGVINRDSQTLQSATHKNMAWEKRNQEKIRELKNISRTLNFPAIGNVENFRPRSAKTASRMVPGARETLNNGGKNA